MLIPHGTTLGVRLADSYRPNTSGDLQREELLMPGLRKVFRDAVGRVHSLRVLSEAGMVSLTNVKMSLRALREVAVWGPNVTALRRAVRLNPDGIALVDDRGSVTYRQLDRRSDAIARGLR